MSTSRDVLLERAVAWFAEHGVSDTSMRTLAAALGTSHRMLHYHFGSREALLAAVMELVERGERAALDRFLSSADDPFDAASEFWHHVADAAETFAPLFFELSSHAMLRRPYAESWRVWLTDEWLEALARVYSRAGATPGQATTLARISLAQARGLLFELALSGDRPTVDAAMAGFTAMVRATLVADGSG